MGSLEHFSIQLKIQRFSCMAQMTVLDRETVRIPVVVTNFRNNIFFTPTQLSILHDSPSDLVFYHLSISYDLYHMRS